MDCYDAMIRRRRLFAEGKISLTAFDPDAQQEREDREYISDEGEREAMITREKSDKEAK